MKSVLFISSSLVIFCLPLSLPSRASGRQCGPAFCWETICRDRLTPVWSSFHKATVTEYRNKCEVEFFYGTQGIYETPLPQKSLPEKSVNIRDYISPSDLNLGDLFKDTSFSSIFKNIDLPATSNDPGLNFRFPENFNLDDILKDIDFSNMDSGRSSPKPSN
jgi:hypothetical protein